MSAPVRWDPMREAVSLHDAMSRLFEHAVMRPGFDAMGATWGTMNVLEAEGRYYCQIALPGIMPDAIELTVRQNTLTVEANVPELLPVDVRKNATYLLREFGAGKFSRSVTFPKDVDGEAVEARSHHGILTIEIPLAQHAQPRRIAVRSGETTSPERQIVDEPAPVGSNSAGHAS